MKIEYLLSVMLIFACLGFVVPKTLQTDSAQKAESGHEGHDHDHGGHDHEDHAEHQPPVVPDHEERAGHDHGQDPHEGHTDHEEHGGDEGHADHEGQEDHGDHEGHEEHGGPADHAGHDDHEEGVARIAPEVLKEVGITAQTAGPGSIGRVIRLPGEVVFNADRIAHVTPTVSGIAKEVRFSVGERVKQGQLMAVLNSRELAAARSAYLAAGARLKLAQANFKREQRLFDEKVGTERAVLEAEQALAESRIELNKAENALYALGYSRDEIDRLGKMKDTEFNTYQLHAPIGGVITQRHLTIGEVIQAEGDEAPFVVADLSTVWVNLTVYQRDLAHVKPGQTVAIRFGHGIPDATGTIDFVSPALDTTTRTATARVVLANPDGWWRPGLFVAGEIETGASEAGVVIPRSAVIEFEGEQVVFVRTGKGFEPRPVELGRATEQRVEVVKGLAPGDRYAARNVLTLKAEMNRAALEHAGHAH